MTGLLSKICANHDVIIRKGETYCPTCKEIEYPKEEINLLEDRLATTLKLVILLNARLNTVDEHTEFTKLEVVAFFDTMTDPG